MDTTTIICDTEFEGRKYAQQLGLEAGEFSLVLANAKVTQPLSKFVLDVSRGEQSEGVVDAIRHAKESATYYVAMFRASA